MAQQVAIPMRLDAFLLNERIVDESVARIAPITQPDFTGLQLRPSLVQNDVQDHIDVTTADSSTTNSRIRHLDTGILRNERCGVYLHWAIPRMYRSGIAQTETASNTSQLAQQHRAERGFAATPTPAASADHASPDFLPIPNRWLVTRRLDLSSILPRNAPVSEFQSWVVESDRIRTLADFAQSPDADLETQCVPFVHAADGVKPTDVLRMQAEVFLGQKFDALQWPGDALLGRDGTQRANLTVLTSSNALLADYQPFNSSVFSIIDDFSYTDGGTVQRLTAATASYSVIGWHADPSQDPFSNSGSDKSVAHSTLLKNSSLSLYGSETKGSAEYTWVNTGPSSRSVCHGVMYSVQWTTSKPRFTWQAEKFAQSFLNAQPLAVGNTGTEALMAYLKSLDKPTELELDLLAMQNLLIKQNDGVDVQQEAQDLLYKLNFGSSPGGTLWTPSGPNSGGTTFTTLANQAKGARSSMDTAESPLDKLNNLNEQQRALDIMHREKAALEWDLFAEWWKAISWPKDTAFDDSAANAIISRLLALDSKTGEIGKAAGTIQQAKDDLGASLAINHASQDPFFVSKDPTILLAGVQSPWPIDYADALQVRLGSRVVTSSTVVGIVPASRDTDASWSALDKHISTLKGQPGQSKFPGDLQTLVFDLLFQEFRALRPILDQNGSEPQLDLTLLPAGSAAPSFHHSQSDANRTTGLDRWWDTQPFLPLFLEWEGQYHHIDFDHWSLQEIASLSTSDSTTGTRKLQYALSTDVRGGKFEVRALSGRTLILPQGSMSLEQSVRQIVQQTPTKQLPPSLSTQTQVDTLVGNIRQLPVLSATLSGFTNHLRTQLAGTHVKPLMRQSGSAPVAMDAAVVPNTVFTKDKLILMGQKTGTTPYGTIVPVDPLTCPFKPATHGQFKFIKFNIIDKFGQVVSAIEPQPRRLDGTTQKNRLFPCLSDSYKPQTLNGVPNTVEPDDAGKCSFIQIQPYLNQDARLNAHMVIENTAPSAGGKWRPSAEWEDPVVGWVILNYPDYGLQFFQPDGKFYREIRKGGPFPLGDAVTKKWLPFDPGNQTTTSPALDRLIAQLSDVKYLDALIKLLSHATADLQHTPNEYSGYLQALVGRPFAVVNLGWSLELATKPLYNQATGTAPQKAPFLLPSSPTSNDAYSFPFKLGDKDRSFDGLVCYFNTDPATNEVDYSKILHYDRSAADEAASAGGTSIGGASTGGARAGNSPDDDNSGAPFIFPPPAPPAKNVAPLPQLQAFYNAAQDATSGPSITDAYNKALQVFGAVVDPFSSVHGYSDILPVKGLQFPHWVLEKALQGMMYFFSAGPLLVTKDVYARDTTTTPARETLVPGADVALPAVAVGDWAWLQPNAAGGLDTIPLSTGEMDDRARFETAPYTALEGYFVLKTPLLKESAPASS